MLRSYQRKRLTINITIYSGLILISVFYNAKFIENFKRLSQVDEIPVGATMR